MKRARVFLAAAVAATLGIAPADAGPYPTEQSIGSSISLIGPSMGYRRYISPEWGLGLDAAYGVFLFSGPAAAAQVLYSPYHADGTRVYVSGGIFAGQFLGNYYGMGNMVIPVVGLGVSRYFTPHLIGHVDLLPLPRIGLMMEF